MRNKRFWKVFGLSVSAIVILVMLFIVGFIFNPFEGTLADMRDVVPRDVDFFLRKQHLADDFSDFPEPRFWEEFEGSRSWQGLRQGPFYQELRQPPVQVDRLIQEIRQGVQQVSDSSSGLLDPVADALGEEVILAGRVGSRPLDQADWCLYTRVSWKLRAGWGLKNIGVLQSLLAGGGIAVQEEAGMLALRMPGGPTPLYVARHLDCMMISNNQDLVADSLQLAEGFREAETFGRGYVYEDGIRKPLQNWEDLTGALQTNAVEFYVSPQNLGPFQELQQSWPDAENEDSMNERVLASFVNLNVWRFLTGSLVFEEDSVSLLARVELDSNKHTPFQREFFREEPQDRSRWLNPFLSMVPETAFACAVMRMPAGDFLHEMYGALSPTDQSLLDDGLRRTGRYNGVRNLIDSINVALLPRTGFVFRKNIPDPDIPVVAVSPIPQIAWVFWVREGMRKPLEDLQEVMRSHYLTFGFEQAYELSVVTNATERILELTSPQIPATGEIAMILFDRFFVISNSGPLIRQLFETQFSGRGSILDGPYMELFERELPSAVNGFVYINGRQFDEVLADYESDIDYTADQTPTQEFMAQHRSDAEEQVRRRKYPQYGSVQGIPPHLEQQFDDDVWAYMQQEWNRLRSQYTAGDRESLAQTMALSRMFSAAYFQVMLERNYINLTARFLVEYR